MSVVCNERTEIRDDDNGGGIRERVTARMRERKIKVKGWEVEHDANNDLFCLFLFFGFFFVKLLTPLAHSLTKCLVREVSSSALL